MQIPIEFSKACCNLHQDIGLFVSSPDELVSVAIDGLNTEERAIVSKFLEKLLSSVDNGAALKNVWRATGSDINFRKPEDLLGFLTAMRSRLA